MSTVVRRKFRSNPYRDASDTWKAIVDLLTKGKSTPANSDLLSVAGIAASVIMDKAPESCPIVVTCDGPRTRIYCIYDDESLDESSADESSLGFNPLEGDWQVSLPCQKEDLAWVQSALKMKTSRITARDLATGISEGQDSKVFGFEPLQLDPERF